jgi:hypothetical protein
MTVTNAGAIPVPSATQSTTINAFYTTLAAQLGTANTGVDAGTAGDNSGCFADVTTAAAATFVSTAANTVTPNRLYWKSGANWAADSGNASAGVLMINVDFVLATQYQDSWSGTGTRGTAPVNYCAQQIWALDGTMSKDIATVQGLNGLTKCTYFINVAADKGGPAFTITNLGYWKFQLHYAEWSGEDMNSKFLATNTYVGTIAAAAASIYPTPIKGTFPASGTAIASITWPTAVQNRLNWFPNSVVSGNVGDFVAYANLAGSPYTDTQVTYDSGILLRDLDAASSFNTAYNTAASTYNTSRTAYNTALTNEKTRAADFFKSIFEAPVKIPSRPCGPSQPAAWGGPTIDWWVANNAFATINATGKAAQYGVFSNLSLTTPSLQSGWLAATPDNTATTPVAAPGHTFGVRGQGNATNAVAGTAWANRVVSATATHGMMVSLFPYDMTDSTGIASGKNVTLKASAIAWRAVKSFNAPAQPAAVSAPDSAAAAYLAAGAAAVAAVAATMF